MEQQNDADEPQLAPGESLRPYRIERRVGTAAFSREVPLRSRTCLTVAEWWPDRHPVLRVARPVLGWAAGGPAVCPTDLRARRTKPDATIIPTFSLERRFEG